jgi:hypothetical protein
LRGPPHAAGHRRGVGHRRTHDPEETDLAEFRHIRQQSAGSGRKPASWKQRLLIGH